MRRTFEKTIRYESRKAYAEVRPRIKGRFATKEEVEAMKAEAALVQQVRIACTSIGWGFIELVGFLASFGFVCPAWEVLL